MFLPFSFLTAIFAEHPMLRAVALPIVPVIGVENFSLARLAAHHAQARPAGNLMAFTRFFTAVLAESPMLRFIGLRVRPIEIVYYYACSFRAALPARPRRTGNVVLLA